MRQPYLYEPVFTDPKCVSVQTITGRAGNMITLTHISLVTFFR